MSAIGGRGCRAVISAGKSCLSACRSLLFAKASIYFDTSKLTNHNIVLSHQGDGWKRCVVGGDWKAKEREEKSLACGARGYSHPAVTFGVWRSSLQDRLSCNGHGITQVRWSGWGLRFWDEEAQLNLGGVPLSADTCRGLCAVPCPLCQWAMVGPAGMTGLLPLTTSLPPPPLLPPLGSLLSLGLG